MNKNYLKNILKLLEKLENTQEETIDRVAAALTAAGFADLVLEDQQEFESFLEENTLFGLWVLLRKK